MSCIAAATTISFLSAISLSTGLRLEDHPRRELRIGVGDRLHQLLVLGRALAGELGRGDRRLDVAQHLGQVAELGLIDGALDGAAVGMAEHDDRLGADELAANSRLPMMSVLTKLPAMRAAKIAPSC